MDTVPPNSNHKPDQQALSARQQDELKAAQFAANTGIPYTDSRELERIETLTGHMPFSMMWQYRIAPLHMYNEHSIELGLTDETDRTKLPELQKQMGTVKLTFKTISRLGFHEILNKIYYQSFKAERGGDFNLFGQKLAAAAPKDAFQLIAQMAFWMGASDIHIEPQSEYARIRFRLDGILHPITNVATHAYEIFLSDLQTRAEITWGSDTPQSGRISFNLMNHDAQILSVNMRIETIPTFHGEEIVVRIFNSETRNLTLDTMGFSPEQVQRLKKVSEHPSGMILTVGPTGSGKTSTLYALINRLNHPDVKIVTLEDPVEYDLPGISQIPVRTEDKELFAEKLRAVMREDPNVVMIGEIRDVDTAKTALQAALTGHLVLSTFHAADASSAISRMLDMVGQNPLFASAVRMIVAQRLARRICKYCVADYKPPQEELEFMQHIVKLMPSKRRPKLAPGLTMRHGKGCEQCHGLGYKGRVAIVEMMAITPDIERLMTSPKRTTAQDVAKAAIKDGMAPLTEDGIIKALAGVTTISEVMRLAEAEID